MMEDTEGKAKVMEGTCFNSKVIMNFYANCTPDAALFLSRKQDSFIGNGFRKNMNGIGI